MAKIIGPLFSMRVSGTLGQIVFDRRGFVYLKKGHRDAKTTNQGNYRLAMMVAQRGVKLCGPNTRQLLKAATPTATWHGYLMKHIIGPQRSSFTRHLQDYNDPALDQAAWEAAAVRAGLRPILVSYADRAAVSPGAQLFCLGSTLYELEIYTNLGRPNGNAEAWKECIVSESGTYTPDPPEEDPPEETPASDLRVEPELLLSPVKELLLLLFVAAACTLALLLQQEAWTAGFALAGLDTADFSNPEQASSWHDGGQDLRNYVTLNDQRERRIPGPMLLSGGIGRDGEVAGIVEAAEEEGKWTGQSAISSAITAMPSQRTCSRRFSPPASIDGLQGAGAKGDGSPWRRRRLRWRSAIMGDSGGGGEGVDEVSGVPRSISDRPPQCRTRCRGGCPLGPAAARGRRLPIRPRSPE
jgi:hypothetical protein